jgi:dolichol-phosphate mannosyltransferase
VNEPEPSPKHKVAVVVPSYRVRNHILAVIESIPSYVAFIFVVDDKCPEATGDFVQSSCPDRRVQVLRNSENLGVGGSVMVGYKRALEVGADVIVKLDGDGQMNGQLIGRLIEPITGNRADYTKGNRFFNVDKIGLMPLHRLIGNAGLSFFSKISSGYWSVFDPNNGFTAIRSECVLNLPLQKIDKRYFFESDMLFRLNLARAIVVDVPMDAIYGNEVSNLSATKSAFEFSLKHTKNFYKRIFYNYFLREFSIASLNLALGSLLLLFGFIFGINRWVHSIGSGTPTNVGALILICMSTLSGLQMLLSFFSYDISHEPRNKA